MKVATAGVTVPISVQATPAARGIQQTQRAVAQSNQQVATTAREAAVAQSQQAAAERQAAAEATRLAQAHRLSAAAQGRVNAVTAAGVNTTTGLAAARAELRAADNAILAAERAVDASMVKGAETAQVAAVETLRLAVARRAEAVAAEQQAIADTTSAAALGKQTQRQEQFRRGLEASSLSLGGVRAATLAASSPFLIGAAAVETFSKTIQAASREQEAAARATKVFGDNIDGLEASAAGFAQTFGLSVSQTLQFEGAIGNVLHVSGLAEAQIPKLSERIVQLGADMAAFNNVSIDKTLDSIQLALVGNSRGLRRFGVELNQAAVNEKALQLSGKESVDQLTRQDRVQARINILFEQTANQQGAAARRSKDLAQETKILSAEMENLGAQVGVTVIPVLTTLASDVSSLLGDINALVTGVKQLAQPLEEASHQGGFLGSALHVVGQAANIGLNPIHRTKVIVDEVANAFQFLHDKIHANDDIVGNAVAPVTALISKFAGLEDPLTIVVRDLEAVQKALQKVTVAGEALSFVRATNQLDTLKEKLTDVQIAAGGSGQGDQLSVLNQAIAVAQRRVSAVSAVSQSSAITAKQKAEAVKERRQAKQDLLDLLTQRKQVEQQQADAATQAAEQIAQNAADAAQKVQDLLAAADQSFINALGLKQGALDIRQQRVQATKSLVDDIAFQNQLQAFLVQQIAAARKTISNELLRAQTIQQLTAALVQSQIAEKGLIAQQKQNAQQAKQAAFDRQAESIDLDISLAQTNKAVSAEIAARQRRIALDQQREKAVRGDIIATKKLRNDIAEQRAAIADLRKELAKRNRDLEQMEFEFLQTQTGFVGNLLSNLLPVAAVVGTVGGGAISTTTPVSTPASGSVPFGQSGALQRRGEGDFTRAAQTSSGPRGASSGQMSTLIHVQRQMLTVMMRLVGQKTHPEAVNQRIHEAASMDILG